jgi:hypothetical protein
MNDISALFAQAGGELSTSVLQGLGGSAPPTISLKDDRFAFVDAAGERTKHDDLKLRCIIIGVNPHGPSKVFWGRSYTGAEGEQERPKCFSDNGIGPSQQCPEPQSATCAQCPNNSWGSAISNMTGKGIKACQDRKKLAVIIPEHNSETVWLLSVPPASFGNLAAYVKHLASHSSNGRKVELYDVVTELSMDSKILKFEAKAAVNDEAKKLILNVWNKGEHKEVVGANDVAIKGLIEGPKKVEQIEAPKNGSLNLQPEVKRGPGRPPKVQAKEEEIPAFLKPTVRAGIVSNPEAPPSGLTQALEEAFSLKTD